MSRFNQKKFLISLSMVALSVGTLSCKPDVQDGDLKIIVGPSTAAVLPVARATCKAPSASPGGLAAPSYEFTKFQYSWNGANPFTMSYIQITLRSGFLSGGVDKSCILASEELLATLGSAPVEVIPGPTVYSASCGIRCGSLKIKDDVTSAYIIGTLKVVGVQTDPDGNSTPVVGEADVALQYDNLTN